MTIRRKVVLSVVAALAAATLYAGFDLWGPRSTNLRQFDPEQVARLDTEMWRSYYDRERLQLFNQLAFLLREQYRMPLLRSYAVGFDAAKAAFIFKDGKNRSDYERALPDLVDYFAAIRKVSETPFDVERAARLELEWWIVHRERERHAPGDLEKALADVAAEVYQMPAARFMDHARYRAQAMLWRDQLAEGSGVSAADWRMIQELLRQSWRSLWNEVNHVE
jgi:hypothetical protein